MPMGSGTASSYGNEPPTLVVDAAGALHHLRLPVVGEHHDLVRAGGVATRPLDAPELLVELAQHIEGVLTF